MELLVTDLLFVRFLSPAAILAAAKLSQTIKIDNTNNNQWVPITDNDGSILAEIKANGNNLGIVNASMFINNGAVREDGTGRLYLDRTITIKPQFAQRSPVDVRLYIKGSEFLALKNAHNSFGQTSFIHTINDMGIFQVDGNCSPTVAAVSPCKEHHRRIMAG